MKFGGTSVATPERRQLVVEHVRREREAGRQVALVISAMGRRGDPYATDTLLDLLRGQGGPLDPRTYAFMFVTGEMISAAVMAHTLELAGFPAACLTGGLAGIRTDEVHMSAVPLHLDGALLRETLAGGRIPVVCGGQGVSQVRGEFTTLGRGGSDTSGVLVGLLAGAQRADIYTDVEYLCAADPRVIPGAPARERISYAAALELARFGAKVVHPGAVRLAADHNLPLRVRSTFSNHPGTLIAGTEDSCPLVGLAVLLEVRLAALPGGQRPPDEVLAALEQHTGMLALGCADGPDMLAAPAGDTAALAGPELARAGLENLRWLEGLSLVSLVTRPDCRAEIEARAAAALERAGLQAAWRGRSERRISFALPAGCWKPAAAALYQALAAYLPPNEGLPLPDGGAPHRDKSPYMEAK